MVPITASIAGSCAELLRKAKIYDPARVNYATKDLHVSCRPARTSQSYKLQLLIATFSRHWQGPLATRPFSLTLTVSHDLRNLLTCLVYREKGVQDNLSFLWMDKRGLEGCGFFAYSWKLPAHSGAFLFTLDNFSFFTYSWSFFAYSFSFFTYSWSFFAYSEKVRLIRALRDCKQRSLTVSKKARTASKKASLGLETPRFKLMFRQL